jgi:hypothetical protein
MKILPGYVSDPDWKGPRCATCARPVGGDGTMMLTCEDANQAHMTFERIPPARRDRFFEMRVWSNAQQACGSLLAALQWMATARGNKGSAIERLADGRGLEVLEEQLDEFPSIAKIAEAAERNQRAFAKAS